MQPLTDSDLEHYRSQGYLVVRDVIDDGLLTALAAAIDECRMRPSMQYRPLSAPGSALVDSDLFRAHDSAAIAALATASPVVDVAARLLHSTDGVVFVEDQWFASAGGSTTASPWHQDSPYYAIDRPFVTIWCPIDPVPAGAQLAVVPGSHLWDRTFALVEFSADASTLGTGPAVAASGLEPVPTIDPASVVRTDARPGDVVAFDARILHSAGGPVDEVLRRFSLRYAPPAARYVRPEWPVAAFWDELAHGLQPGDPLQCDVFPLVGFASPGA